MANFSYTALDADGKEREGTIDALNIDLAIAALQRRSLVISHIEPIAKKAEPGSKFSNNITIFDRVTNEDIVMLSRQMTTLFEAQVSALRAFRLLAAEARTAKLALKLGEVADEIQSGSTISMALSHHPDVFSPFYVNMVRAGEESGKLDETFSFLAAYLDRNFEITQKARNALIYPAFIILTFAVVMTLMMTVVIPNLAGMLTSVGGAEPLPTVIVLGVSAFFKTYIIFILIILLGFGAFIYRYSQTPKGSEVLSRIRLKTPAIGGIYEKIFLSRIADNLSTMLRSGIQILRAIEITAAVVGDPVYSHILEEASNDVKGGLPLSDALRKHPEMPGIVVAMIKIGEETGNMGTILDTIARFYRREVDNAVDTLVGLIEPIMIVGLAVGVGILLAAVLLPIYNIASSF
ncbi:MAG TPA: type II secretion system F family protein [Candidatus Paceibacterota bacterium]|nr:type II secretion system F family protein [Candidatus Paceibacterota bacterium]